MGVTTEGAEEWVEAIAFNYGQDFWMGGMNEQLTIR